MSEVICDYCNGEASLVNGGVIYPHRQDLKDMKFYECKPCHAYVGTHRGTKMPLGRLANAKLRKAKQAAHRAFDPIWRGVKGQKRGDAYAWLAGQLGITTEECHIGMFNEDMCSRVVLVSNERTRKSKE